MLELVFNSLLIVVDPPGLAPIFASPTVLRSRTVREQEETSYEHDVSVFPLTTP